MMSMCVTVWVSWKTFSGFILAPSLVGLFVGFYDSTESETDQYFIWGMKF